MTTVVNIPSLADRIEQRIAKGELEHLAIFAVCHRSDIDDLLDLAVPIEVQTDSEAFLSALLACVAEISPAARDYIVEAIIDHVSGRT